jgi:uncharacterized protein
MSRFGFVEIPTSDLDESIAFYQGLFGWTFNRLPGNRYAFFKTPGGIHGALSGDDQPGQGVIVYLEADIAATLEKAARLGGRTVVPKTLITAEEGYYGRFADPSGNVLGLWSKD